MTSTPSIIIIRNSIPLDVSSLVVNNFSYVHLLEILREDFPGCL